jgi:hypothetical protein
MAGEDLDSLGTYDEELKKFAKIPGEIADAIQNLNLYASDVNRTFGQMRQRISDAVREISLATPELNKVGGTAKDATQTIIDTSSALKKNVIASSEAITELFTTSKVLGKDVESIVSTMADVGIQFGNVQENMVGAVNYVQSIGMNTQQIMGDVVNNAELLNRFNFDGGVLGLTKMAAQSAMLRANMRDAENFAEKVFEPEGAIETAAAFQRLGISVGALSDPFALMNASINDPAGLQMSLAEAAKKFTIFDEKTKSFKIDPGGIRQMKELAKAAGMSYDNFTKMGLAAANSERLFSQIRFAGNLSEEDKMYISSIAEMKGGEYQIKVRDEKGEEVFKNIRDLSEEQLKQAVEQNKKEPKTMEEIAKAQMDTGKVMAGDIASIRNRIVYGVAGADGVRQIPEITRKLGESVTDALQKIAPETKDIQNVTGKAITELGKSMADVIQGNKSFQDVGKELMDKLKGSGVDISQFADKMGTLPEKLMDSVYEKFKDDRSELGKMISGYLKPGSSARGEFQKGMKSTMDLGKMTKSAQVTENKTVTHDGKITFEFKSDGSMDPQVVRTIEKWVESQEGSKKLYTLLSTMKDATGQSILEKAKK